MMSKRGDPEFPWERQKGETHKAFEAFTVYRTTGRRRSIKNAAQALKKQASLLGRWSSKWNWVERAAEWDAYYEAEQEDEEAEELEKAHIRHRIMARQGLDKIFLRLQSMNPDQIPVPSLGGLARTLVDIELNSYGEPTMEQGFGGSAPDIMVVDWGLSDDDGGESSPPEETTSDITESAPEHDPASGDADLG